MHVPTQETTSFRLPLKKRIFLHPQVQAAACWLVAGFIRFFWLTCSIKRHYHPLSLPYMQGHENAIFCFWHGRMVVFPCAKPKGRTMHVLISHHRDGELIAKVIKHFDIEAVRGSSSRGAREALRNMIKLINAGDNISITPDGPRGPALVAQEGAATLARLANRPLLPVTFSATRCWRLSSWDRFMIPKPFSTIVVKVGEPLTSLDTAMLQASLVQLTQEADAQCLHTKDAIC